MGEPKLASLRLTCDSFDPESVIVGCLALNVGATITGESS